MTTEKDNTKQTETITKYTNTIPVFLDEVGEFEPNSVPPNQLWDIVGCTSHHIIIQELQSRKKLSMAPAVFSLSFQRKELQVQG